MSTGVCLSEESPRGRQPRNKGPWQPTHFRRRAVKRRGDTIYRLWIIMYVAKVEKQKLAWEIYAQTFCMYIHTYIFTHRRVYMNICMFMYISVCVS